MESTYTTLHIALKRGERKLVQRAAAADEVPMSAWVREVALTAAAKIVARQLVAGDE